MAKRLLIGCGALVVLVGLVLVGIGWWVKKTQFLESGGALRPGLAAYDVRHYALEVAVDPEDRSIRGEVTARVQMLELRDQLELDMDQRLTVDGLVVDGDEVSYDHSEGVLTFGVPGAPGAGETVEVTVAYSGRPKVALKAPWIDGFVWSETESGSPWIGVTTQGDGCDIWWPCKDHPSDWPDEGMDIRLSVPEGLIGLSNGRPVGRPEVADGRVTTAWRVTHPIDPYLVTVNIGPYVPVETTYRGADGSLEMPIVFWALPEHVEEAERMWPQAARILEVFGRRFREYPFLDDKFWVAEAPYLGMEHQTLVAYGDDFTDNDFGFDTLLLHEMAHEWWGNAVSVADWADFWIQEGFATYSEAVYVLDTLGREDYLAYMADMRSRIANDHPLVRGRNLTSYEAYSGDIYVKGAWVLHTLRWLVGDAAHDEMLRRFATDPWTGSAKVDTTDFIALAAEVAGRDLEWFFDRYVFTAPLPVLHREVVGSGVERLRWEPDEFLMPVPVQVDGEIRVLDPVAGPMEMPAGGAIDPEGWLLFEVVPGP
jgi:aminopeptidase N